MPLAFQDPGLLWLTAAGAVPVLAHLVARTRPREERLPTLEFLQRAAKRVWRVRRPRDLFFLLLRILAILALAAAFARPLWISAEGWAGASAGKHLVVIVDRTGSMSGLDRGQSRFALAKARALEALRGAGRLESVNLVWMGASPEAVYPTMGRALEPLEAALREAEVTGESGSGEEALRLALDRLAETQGKRELIVVSDFQRGSWGEAAPTLPAGVSVVYLPVGGEAGNLALADLQVDPARPFPGEVANATIVVRNFSTERRTVPLSLTVGSARQTQSLEIEAWGEAQALFEVTPPEGASEFSVAAAIEGGGDDLPADDQRWAVTKAREVIRVNLELPEGGVDRLEKEVWSRVLSSLPWLREVEETGSADVLIASALPEESAAQAKSLLDRGGSVFLRPVASGDFAGVPLPNPLAQPVRDARGADEAGWRIVVAREDDKLFRLFADGEYGDPAAGTVSERVLVEAHDATAEVWRGWDLLLRYDDGVPALLRSGSIWWWNLPFDPKRSTWPSQPGFLPLVGEALLLAAPAAATVAHGSATPGSFVRWEPAQFPDGGTVVLLDRENETVPIEEDRGSAGLAYRTVAALQPGAYRWAVRDAELERDEILGHTAVNFPEAEMEPRSVEIAGWTSASGGTGQTVAATRPDWSKLRDGRPLWPALVGIALAFLALEALLLATAFVRRTREAASAR